MRLDCVRWRWDDFARMRCDYIYRCNCAIVLARRVCMCLCAWHLSLMARFTATHICVYQCEAHQCDAMA